ncbi:hypothetical protein D9M71_545970 [compost metagenome]
MRLGDGFLRRLAPVDIGRVDVGGDHQQVACQLFGQQGRAEVLVDHRFHALQLAVPIQGRDATTTGADHHRALFQQPLDRADLDDPSRARAGHHATELVAIGGDAPAFVPGQALGFFLGVDRADRLGRLLEGRVGAVHLDLGEDGSEGQLGRQQVAQLLFDHVADHAFGLGAEDVQRVGVGGIIGRALQGQQADLRAVAMGNHQFVAGGHLGDLLAGDAHVLALILRGHGLATAQQGVAAQGDD